MDKQVFQDPSVNLALTNKFINLKLDMEKGEGIDLRNRFNVTSFPTLIFLNSEGKVIDKQAGALTKEEFILFAKSAATGQSVFLELSEKYLSGERSISLLSKYADLLKIGRDPQSPKVADEWFDVLSYEQRVSDEGLHIYKYFLSEAGTSINLKSYKFLAGNRAAYDKLYSKDSMDLIVSKILRKALQYSLSKSDTISFLETLAESYRQDFALARLNAARWELIYYQRRDSSNFLRLASHFSQTFFLDQPDDLMGTAWVIVDLFPSQQNLVFAKKVIDKSILLDPLNVMSYEVKAKILNMKENKESAVSFLRASIAYLKGKSINASSLEKLMSKL